MATFIPGFTTGSGHNRIASVRAVGVPVELDGVPLKPQSAAGALETVPVVGNLDGMDDHDWKRGLPGIVRNEVSLKALTMPPVGASVDVTGAKRLADAHAEFVCLQEPTEARAARTATVVVSDDEADAGRQQPPRSSRPNEPGSFEPTNFVKERAEAAKQTAASKTVTKRATASMVTKKATGSGKSTDRGRPTAGKRKASARPSDSPPLASSQTKQDAKRLADLASAAKRSKSEHAALKTGIVALKKTRDRGRRDATAAARIAAVAASKACRDADALSSKNVELQRTIAQGRERRNAQGREQQPSRGVTPARQQHQTRARERWHRGDGWGHGLLGNCDGNGCQGTA